MNLHKEGIVYTPEKIVNYIAKTAIHKFLIEKINVKFSTKFLNLNKLIGHSVQKTKNRGIVSDVFINKSKKEKLEYILNVLKGLTILDPAVGNGRFLIAALKIIEKLYLKLKELGIINWSHYEIREYIISKTLYGVDIESEAIENTKKKMFIVLKDMISDLKKVMDFPNIDSNYKVGNAIIGLVDSKEVPTLDDIDLENCFYNEIKSVFQSNKDLRNLNLTEREKRVMLSNLKPFHWFSEFPVIYVNGGFDIIIGNPPYISNKNLTSLEKAIFHKIYETPKGLLNTFGIFIERSIKLCHSQSIISHVVHKNIIRSNNYDLLREYLLKNITIEEIIDIGAGAFESITAETIILIFKAESPPKDHKIIIKTKFPIQKSIPPPDNSIKYISQNTFLKQVNYNINLNLQHKELEIINYIKKNKDCDLKEFFEAKTCIATGDDERFLKNYKKNELYKKTLKGKNIGRFFIDSDNLYVNYDSNVLHRARDEEIFLKPEKLIMQTISANLTVAYDNQNYYPLSTCIAIIPKDSGNDDISIKYLLLLMNSKLMNFYYDFVFNLGAYLTTEISVTNVNKLPLKLQKNYNNFNILSDIMVTMNKNDILREQNKEFILFYEELINLLIFEVVFSQKFQMEGLKISLIDLISQYLINVNLNSIEKIHECIINIQTDKDISHESQKIKNHSWVKIIEEFFIKNG
ncbi:MAG: Eco57I restriction-modification methylase domain-containing protein [Promethearchaeota archaeon]